MRTVIIIPTLREADNLRKLIPEISRLVPEATVLISDDHSEDGTRDLAGDRVYVLDRLVNHGYGKAVLDGFKWAIGNDYDYIVTMDADFSHDPREIPKMLDMLKEKEIVVGSRYVNGGGVINWSGFRKILSKFANLYVRAILRTGVKDNTTGFVAYRKKIIKKLLKNPPKSEGYAFLVEARNILKNNNIAEIPITYSERREGKSKMSWKIIWESIWLPWKLL